MACPLAAGGVKGSKKALRGEESDGGILFGMCQTSGACCRLLRGAELCSPRRDLGAQSAKNTLGSRGRQAHAARGLGST